MKIIKRNGLEDTFNPSKVLTRIKKAGKGLSVDGDELCVKVIQGMADSMSTKDVDNLIARVAAGMTIQHPDYSKLAANICVSRHHKETSNDFLVTVKELFYLGIVTEKFKNKVKDNIQEIEKVIDYKRDFNFDYFGWSTLEDIYLLEFEGKIYERPQHMYMRVAIHLYDDINDSLAYYDLVSSQQISPATPILLNSGTKNGSLISCNLTFNSADSTEGLQKTFKNITTASSASEGIGLAMHNIRSKESYVGGKGKAAGLLKFAKVVNEGMRFWNQMGKRPGACAIYIETWHKDILDILDIRKNTGIDEERARDLFLALWISDNFMKAVEEKKDWYLFCPNDIKKAGLKPFYEIFGEEFEEEYEKAVALGLGKQIKATELWIRILDAQMETGVPYMLFKDEINRKSAQSNIGTIKSSNLCLDGNTIVDVLIDGEEHKTDIKTVVEIIINEDKEIKIKSLNTQTNKIEYMNVVDGGLMSKSSEVLKITDSVTDKYIICTPSHKIFTQNRGYVEAKDLVESDELNINKIQPDKGGKIKIEKLNYKVPVYDLTVEDNHNFYANDILVHNCAEIVEYSDADTTAQCVLHSIPLQKYWINNKFNWKGLEVAVTAIVHALNHVIDINKYTSKEAKKGAEEQRALAIGVQGLADLFSDMGIAFTSDEAKKLNKEIFEAIYFYALKASNEQAKKENRVYKYFEGSPASKGILQWHMWGLTKEDLSGRHDWDKLIESIIEYGLLNSLVTGLMPTASSANVIGSNEAFEVYTYNLYTRKTKAGEFVILKKRLVIDLEKEGLWNDVVRNEIIRNNGGIQNIPIIEDRLKEIHKTSYEISQKELLSMSADRGPFIDQTQSMNIFMEKPTINKLTSSHFYAWKRGLKTAMYYLRSQGVNMRAKHLGSDLTKQDVIIEKPEDSDQSCTNCGS